MAVDCEAIDVHSEAGVSVITLLNRTIVAEDKVATIREAIHPLIGSGHRNLVFDLSRVEYLGSSMLGVFLGAKKKIGAIARAAPGPGPTAMPRELVPLAGDRPARAGPKGPRLRSRVFEVYPDRQSAIEAFTGAGSGHGWVVLCNVRPDLMDLFRVC